MSIGIYPADTDVDNAVINDANNGLRFTIAAANHTYGQSPDANDWSPARVNNANVWTVSAFKQGDDFAVSFTCNTAYGSNYGNPPVDYSEPGDEILSLWRGGGTATECGTSMAAPHLAGLLLALGQTPTTVGHVSNDPDGTPDAIASGRVLAPTLTGTVQNDREHLNWNAVAHSSKYQIYFHSDEPAAGTGGGYVLWDETTSTSYDGLSLNQSHSGDPNYIRYTASYYIEVVGADGFHNNNSNTITFFYWRPSDNGCGPFGC